MPPIQIFAESRNQLTPTDLGAESKPNHIKVDPTNMSTCDEEADIDESGSKTKTEKRVRARARNRWKKPVWGISRIDCCEGGNVHRVTQDKNADPDRSTMVEEEDT